MNDQPIGETPANVPSAVTPQELTPEGVVSAAADAAKNLVAPVETANPTPSTETDVPSTSTAADFNGSKDTWEMPVYDLSTPSKNLASTSEDSVGAKDSSPVPEPVAVDTAARPILDTTAEINPSTFTEQSSPVQDTREPVAAPEAGISAWNMEDTPAPEATTVTTTTTTVVTPPEAAATSYGEAPAQEPAAPTEPTA